MKLLSIPALFQLAPLVVALVGLAPEGRASVPYCPGDGSGAACPCANSGTTAGNGCANSVFAAGAVLTDTGTAGASVITDTLALTATNVTGPGLFFQGTATVLPVTFGDGLLCTGGTLVRIGVVVPSAGVATFPQGTQPQIHVAGAVANTNVRHYQFWYRDAAPLFCPSATFNLTNGLTITWGP
jgi:hypothetical protein